MPEMRLQAEPRQTIGKHTKALRRVGQVPCNVYGGGGEPIPIQVEARTLHQLVSHGAEHSVITLTIANQEKPQPVLLREVQRDPRTSAILHAEFQRLNMDKPVTVTVPIVLTGESQPIADGTATLIRGVAVLEMESLPANLPSTITVDISVLKDFNQAIHVSDIPIPKGVTVITSKDDVVAKVERRPLAATVPELTREEAEAEVTRAGNENLDHASEA